MGRFLCQTPGDTEALGERLAQTLRPGTLVAFTGAMGAGKTTFCRGLARGLGCTDPVQSPTFAIANLYRGPVPLAHFDAWRITGPDDLETAGFYDYLDTGAIVALEWSEKVAGLLPANPVRVDIVALPDGTRQITVEGVALE